MGEPIGAARTPKMLADGGLKVKIAVGCAAVLAVGAWLAPRAVSPRLAAPQEHAAPLIEEQVQLRQEDRPFSGVQEAAARVGRHGVAILPAASRPAPSRNDYAEMAAPSPAPGGYGVFVSDTHVLTHSAALGGRSAVEIAVADASMAADVVAYDPASGLVLLRASAGAHEPAPLALRAPVLGELAIGIGGSGDRRTAVPTFVTGVDADAYAVGSVGGELLAGMPLFNLAGELFAVAVPADRSFRGLAVQKATEGLLARAASGDRRASAGLGLQDLTGRLTEAFGAGGVVVSEVLPGGPADAADLRVGDLLLAVGDAAVDSADAATAALMAARIGTPVTLRVRRGRRETEVAVTPVVAYEVAALAGSDDERNAGQEARALLPAGVLQAAAIPPAARVIAVNLRPATTRAQVQRALRLARQAVPVLLREGRSQYFVAVEPAR